MLEKLPVIVGFGGVNPAGRSSFHHGYRRLVWEGLQAADLESMWVGLATMTGRAVFTDGALRRPGGGSVSAAELVAELRDSLLKDTCIRRIESSHFDVDAVPFNARMSMAPAEGALRFITSARQLPESLPAGWSVQHLAKGQVEVSLSETQDWLLAQTKAASVSSAGQLPTGFDPKSLHPSRNHPRGLQMAVFAASDALRSVGIPWEQILQAVAPDQIAVYASSSMGQLDDAGTGGMYKAPHVGKRITSKQLPLGFAEMPADFVNAYVLGNVGSTGGAVGACATFLYNLRSGVEDIRAGRRRVVLVGVSEAAINAEAMEGYAAMGALATDAELLALDAHLGAEGPDHRRACRPFGYNAGFTMGESAQYLVLFDDALALELGADIYGAVPGVEVHADGFKRSIAGPGIGNVITLGKTLALARAILGDQRLRDQTYVHAHGTGTPQNRVTESRILDQLAGVFGIDQWAVAAVKCYLGHSLGAAAGDQIAAALGVWRYGLIPGVFTLDEVADDVHREHLQFSQGHVERDPESLAAAVINAKGFGGNNATALVLSPTCTLDLLRRRHGAKALQAHQRSLDGVRATAAAYDERMVRGQEVPIYRFGEGVLEDTDLLCSANAIEIPGLSMAIDLRAESPFGGLGD